jgi:hypothetical protein
MRRPVAQLRRARSWLRLDACPSLLTLAVLAVTPVARAQNTQLPPSLLLPNYDRVSPGLIEALEAGAFIARARNAPAVAYNPAGISLSDRTILNASTQGYQITLLGGSGFEHASPVSSFESLPSFLGVVFGRDLIDWEAVRLGFAVVTPVHWDQSVVANSQPEPERRVSYSVSSIFSTTTPTFSVGWAVASSFRLGASIEFPYTSLSDQGQLSAEVTTPTASQGSIRNVTAGGSTLDVVGVLGAQWSPLRWLDLGLLIRTPGLKVLSTGSLHIESLATVPSGGSRHTLFDDPDVRFEYRAPLEISMGAAFAIDRVQFEVDLRWHDGTKTYSLFSSNQQGRLVDTTSGGPVVTSFPFPGVPYRARPVLNGSVGAHITLTQALNFSAGLYLDQSPVDLLGQGFRRVDLIGVRTGIGLQLGGFGASVGIGWEYGKATDDLVPDTAAQTEHEELTLNTFSILFSVSYKF